MNGIVKGAVNWHGGDTRARPLILCSLMSGTVYTEHTSEPEQLLVLPFQLDWTPGSIKLDTMDSSVVGVCRMLFLFLKCLLLCDQKCRGR